MLRFPTMLLALLLAALLALPATASAEPELAIQDDTVFVFGHPGLARADGYQAAKRIDATSLRINVLWTKALADGGKSKKRPKPIRYDWSVYDAAIADARAHGLQVQLTVSTPSPAWATGNRKVGVFKTKPKLFAQFAADVARRYRGQVRSISIINEPNWPSWIKPRILCKKVKGRKQCKNQAPREYRELYRRSYSAIKKVDRSIPVWFGEIAPQGRKTNRGPVTAPLQFLRESLCVGRNYGRSSCGGLKTDGLAIHPYYLGFPPTATPPSRDDLSMAVLGRVDQALRKLEASKALTLPSGRGQIPVYLTEFGFLTAGKRAATEQQQADWMMESIAMASQHARVKQLLLYQLIDPVFERHPWQSGLLRRDGSVRPVFERLAQR